MRLVMLVLFGAVCQVVEAQATSLVATFVPMRDGARLAAFVSEPRTASQPTTLVVLHGGPGTTHAYLRPEWDALARFGRVVYYDQRGCGASTRRAPYSWQGQVRDLEDLLDRLSPNESVVLTGSSWGTLLALAYTVAHPERVRALVLSGIVPWPGRGLPLLTATLDSFARGTGYYPYARSDSQPPDSGVLALRAFGARAASRRVLVCPAVTLSITPGRGSMPPLAALGRVSSRVLVVSGDSLGQTPSDGAVALAAALPAARLEVLAGLGHDPWYADPDRFFALVTAFLQEVLGTSGPA